ncbi:MAG: SMC-Scp complex subunit ScpB [Oligoflexus sp.]
MDTKKKAKATKSAKKREKKNNPAAASMDAGSVESALDFEIQMDFADDDFVEQPADTTDLVTATPDEDDVAEELTSDLTDLALKSADEEESSEEQTQEAEELAENEVEAGSDNPAEAAEAIEPIVVENIAEQAADDDLPFSEFEEIFVGELAQNASEAKADVKENQAKGSHSSSSDQSLNFTEALNLEGQVEALLFASAKPLKSTDILEILQEDSDTDPSLKDIEKTIQSLVRWYEERSGGFRLESIKGQGYQFQTVPAAAALMERLFSSRPRPLSRAALETLSIIAYRQPVTRADVEYVRGVDAGSIIKNLLDRSLIACVGRKEDSGRPMLFGTTDEFLKVFRLQKLSDLPPLASFQPSAEAISRAMDDLSEDEANQSEGVDVEPFIGDDSLEKPELSPGLNEDDQELQGEETELELDLEFSGVSKLQEESPDQNAAGQDASLTVEMGASEGSVKESEALQQTIQGAVFHAMDADPDGQADDHGDGNDQDSKISVTDGTELSAGSGEVDSGGSHRSERAGDRPARDAD